MGMSIDAKRNIRLTSKKDGLGWVFAHSEYCSENYNVENACSVYRRSPERVAQEVKEKGMYQIWAYMNIPCRKKETCIEIGFDRYGRFQSWEVNHGRGNIPKKYKKEMFDTLCQWAMKDGWLEAEDGND
jgi:hypothetical protein